MATPASESVPGEDAGSNSSGGGSSSSRAIEIVAHGHRDVVQAIAFNAYGDRCATGSVDGKIRVFNRHRDGTWRMCDNWGAHGGEILELQWLPPTVYPNLLASLGIEGRFKLWAEDPSAAPGRRFSTRGSNGKAAFESRSGRHPYRSFSVRHDEATRSTYFALLASDGHLSVHESEEPEAVGDYARIDDFQALSRPNSGSGSGFARRGEESTCFTVRFDPNPEPCYAALRAGVPVDALGLVVAGADIVRVFRARDTVASSFGAATRAREFYLAAEISGHGGLVRDVAWAPGSYRGYDMIATACQDGYVRVFRIDASAPSSSDANGNGNGAGSTSWATADVTGAGRHDHQQSQGQNLFSSRATASAPRSRAPSHSGIRAEIDKSGTHGERTATGQPGQVPHAARELSRLDLHRSPVWRVGFDDDGHILGSVGDDGKLICYRQTPDGSWAKSSELGMMKTRMAVP